MIDQRTEKIDTQAALAIVERLNSYVATGKSLDRLAYTCAIEEEKIQNIVAGQVFAHKKEQLLFWAPEILQRVSDYLDTLEVLDDDAAYAITPTFNRILALIEHAHHNNIILAITGTWGIGKSQVARYYAASHPRRYNRPGAVYVPLNETENSPRQVLGKILHHLGIPGGKQSQRSMMQTALGIFRAGDHLILDECQKVREALETISALHDEAGIGITMIGNPDFSSAVWGKEGAFNALASRAHRFDFPANTEQDVDAWLAWKGLPEGLDTRERTAFVKAAMNVGTNGRSWGGLRALRHVYDMAGTLYKGQRLTAETMLHMINATKAGNTAKREAS
jgi:DNA transposition AAA+ family ATPase